MDSEQCHPRLSDNGERSSPDIYSPMQAILDLLNELDVHQLNDLGAYIDQKRASRSMAPPTEQLTCREKEVLVLVASGYNRKEIGKVLGISACTAAKHISNIYRKLGVSSIAEATRVALVENIS